MEIAIKNKSTSKVLTNYKLRRISQCVLEPVSKEMGLKGAEVSIVFVDEPEIQHLNRFYRHEDEVTDVMAFPLNDKKFNHIGPRILGDIVVCLPRAVEQAEDNEHPPEREIAVLILHGMLHLLGYGDDTPDEYEEIERLQTEYLQKAEQAFSLWEQGKRIRRRRRKY